MNNIIVKSSHLLRIKNKNIMLVIIKFGILLVPVLFALYALVHGIKRRNILLILFPVMFLLFMGIWLWIIIATT
jgi:hypothetical protein